MKIFCKRYLNVFELNKISGPTLEVSKDPNIQLTIICKKTTIDVKLNKNHKKSNGDGFFILVFGFCQFPKSSNKIEINRITITNGQKGDGNAKIHHKSGYGDGRVFDLKYFLQTLLFQTIFGECVKI